MYRESEKLQTLTSLFASARCEAAEPLAKAELTVLYEATGTSLLVNAPVQRSARRQHVHCRHEDSLPPSACVLVLDAPAAARSAFRNCNASKSHM